MSHSVNSVTLSGNLGRNADLKYTQKGTAVSNFSIAVTEKFSSGDDKTHWFTCVLWGKLAEAVSQYLLKGAKVTVQGKLEVQEYEDKQGNKRSKTQVIVSNLDIHSSIGAPQSFEAAPNQTSQPYKAPETPTTFADDDIPF